MTKLIDCSFLEKRQTVLFSATQTRSVEDLARISLKKTPLYVGVDDHKEVATVDGLEQVTTVYFVCQQTCIMFILCRVMWYVHQSEDFCYYSLFSRRISRKR